MSNVIRSVTLQNGNFYMVGSSRDLTEVTKSISSTINNYGIVMVEIFGENEKLIASIVGGQVEIKYF